MGIKKKVADTLTDQQRIEFAKNIEHFYEAGFAKRKQILLFAFLKGIATGFGVFLGGTILIALMLWLLGQLGHIPLIGDLAEATRESINNDKPSD